MGSLRRFFLRLDEQVEDRPPIAVTIALLVLGLYLVIRSLVLSPGLSYGLIILTPDVQAARIVDPESKQILIDSLTADGADVSDPRVAEDLVNLVEAIRTLESAWPNLVHSLDAVLAHCRPRGHRMEIYRAVAREVGLSAASLRRRQTEYSPDESGIAVPGFFEAFRTEAAQKYTEKQTNGSEI